MISLIVAYGKNNRVIGKNNQIPWHIKEEFIHFKEYTMGKTLVMGDNTFISIGKPLPGRKSIVVSLNDFQYDHEDVRVSNDLFSVLNEYKNKDEELVVCGGATIYRLSLPLVDKLVISEIKGEYEGDAFFPDITNDFKLINIEEHEMFDVKTYIRKND